MGAIQGAINSMIGSASHAVRAVGAYQALKAKNDAAATKGAEGTSPQAQARDRAMQSAANEQQAKSTQRRNFLEYLKKQPTSLGGTIGQLPSEMQKKIASQYTKSQRKRIMDAMDKEKK